MSMFGEFKTFALRGNVMDMAIGIVIGAAFGKIVSSFVSNIVMPPLGLMIGGVDFSDLAVVLRQASADGTVEAVTLGYGAFIQAVVDFLIVALAIFVAVRMMNTLQRKEDEKPAAPPAPSEEVVLLTEIRDALKSRG